MRNLVFPTVLFGCRYSRQLWWTQREGHPTGEHTGLLTMPELAESCSSFFKPLGVGCSNLPCLLSYLFVLKESNVPCRFPLSGNHQINSIYKIVFWQCAQNVLIFHLLFISVNCRNLVYKSLHWPLAYYEPQLTPSCMKENWSLKTHA